MSVARFAFGPRLKAHRERQGITLQDIAETTKIGASLLSSLERNDVSQWPKGIYRRAFLRSYARAIDIPFEAVWSEFVQLFPEDGTVSPAARFTDATQLRLTLEDGSRRFQSPSTRHLLAATIDIAVVMTLGALASLVTGFTVWPCLTITSLLYGTAATAFVGGSPALWYLRTHRPRQSAAARDHELVVGTAADADVSDPPVTHVSGREAPVLVPAHRPRIVAVSSRSPAPVEARERRVADR